MHKLAPALMLILISAYWPSIALAQGAAETRSHADITHDALAATFNATNLELIERSCDSQNKPGSEGASEARRHFADDNFSKAVAYMDRQKKLILDFSAGADTNEKDRARALYHLGLLLHTAQDFYSHTNYIELTAKNIMERNHGVIADPYAMELVDWSKLTTHPTNALQSSPEIYKDAADAPEGKIALGKSNCFRVAKEMAVKETVRQWASLEALIKLRHAGRAPAILTAMKQASCPYITDLDKLQDID